MQELKNSYSKMLEIRLFEQTLLEKFATGAFGGTTHTYIGQEANAVGIIPFLDPQDVIFSNHRCHGHFLAYGGSPQALYAEMMGKPSGVCAGKGGSQHLHWKNFYSSGIQGSLVPVGVGMAYANKLSHQNSLSVIYIGDGTLGEGVVYESLNLSQVFPSPVLFIVENNHIAQTTPTQKVLAGSIAQRFQAFGISATELDTSDVTLIQHTAQPILAQIRETQTPQALILNTARLAPHSKRDDTRSENEITNLKNNRDPLTIFQQAHPNLFDYKQIEQEMQNNINQAYQNALESPELIIKED
jgi:TPP-dependent pyruvate/acetoin dehydrogenase alpha subunit